MSKHTPDNDIAGDATDAIEIDEFVAPSRNVHHDQHGDYSHELSDDDAEATTRALIRFVPLAYGLLLGALSDHLVLGAAAGLAIAVAFDLSMGGDSLVRALLRPSRDLLCPLVAALAGGVAWMIRAMGLAVPGALRDVRCRARYL